MLTTSLFLGLASSELAGQLLARFPVGTYILRLSRDGNLAGTLDPDWAVSYVAGASHVKKVLVLAPPKGWSLAGTAQRHDSLEAMLAANFRQAWQPAFGDGKAATRRRQVQEYLLLSAAQGTTSVDYNVMVSLDVSPVASRC